ncbi:MAG: YraN family protein [Lachnospiraceae bacterium]|nr:YraN family protein [Lachnospiraceae bacterium]
MGTHYEKIAVEYLKKQGYQILETNFRCKMGEADIVARDGEYLCFIEVKYRTGSNAGAPEDAVDFKKQKRICRVSEFYLLRYGKNMSEQIRYDVVAITDGQIRLYQNAFSYIPR